MKTKNDRNKQISNSKSSRLEGFDMIKEGLYL